MINKVTNSSGFGCRDLISNYPTSSGARRTVGDGRGRNINKTEFKIAIWNVRSLYQTGKLENVMLKAKQMDIVILGISDVRWARSDKVARGEYNFNFLGEGEGQTPVRCGTVSEEKAQQHDQK